LLDSEAQILQDQLGRLPEDKMLLMAGLILGDRLRTKNSDSKLLGDNLIKVQEELSSVKEQMKNIKTERNPITKEPRNLIQISKMLDEIILDLSNTVKDNKPITSSNFQTESSDSQEKLL
jgi:hypothetical protein